MIGYWIFQAKAAEPPVSQVQMHLFTQASLRANAKAVAHDQHANDQGWINRGPACVAVMWSQVLMQFAQVEELIDAT